MPRKRRIAPRLAFWLPRDHTSLKDERKNHERDGELYAKAIDDGDDLEFRLYPIGENRFGRKDGMIELTFSEVWVTYIGQTCKKL
ncbi:MAG: hypothetical protein II409_03565 [Clostridia bacterium]|nr:hypothetical protein [Clostridia bacterium]